MSDDARQPMTGREKYDARRAEGNPWRGVKRALRDAEILAEKVRGRASLAEMAMFDAVVVPDETYRLAAEACLLAQQLDRALRAATDPVYALHYYGEQTAEDTRIGGSFACGPAGCDVRIGGGVR